jgi:hypothetical protein
MAATNGPMLMRNTVSFDTYSQKRGLKQGSRKPAKKQIKIGKEQTEEIDAQKLLHSTPFMLYIIKKTPDSTKQQEPEVIVLFSEENQTLGADFLELKTKKIPTKLDEQSQIAFALGYMSPRGIEFVEDLTCAVGMSNLEQGRKFVLKNTANQVNQLAITVERKGTNFLEISEIQATIHKTAVKV